MTAVDLPISGRVQTVLEVPGGPFHFLCFCTGRRMKDSKSMKDERQRKDVRKKEGKGRHPLMDLCSLK